jgi:surface antigen
MAGLVPQHVSRLPSYSGTGRQRLPRIIAILLLGLSSGGCAMSGQLGSLFSKPSRDEVTAYADPSNDGSTGSIERTSGAVRLPPEADLAYARAAVVQVLSRGSKDVSAPWENPRSGARGTVTPIATNYTQYGNVCRDFLASHVVDRAEIWMQGEACRPQKGAWEVKSLRPWTRS